VSLSGGGVAVPWRCPTVVRWLPLICLVQRTNLDCYTVRRFPVLLVRCKQMCDPEVVVLCRHDEVGRCHRMAERVPARIWATHPA
jgi:hypothetical protein